jgi:hypothetical protein
MPKGCACLADASETGSNGILSKSGHLVGVKPPETVQWLLGGGAEWPDKAGQVSFKPLGTLRGGGLDDE